MSDYAIGIDLGTSTSEVAIFHNGRPMVIRDVDTRAPVVPSLVAMNPSGKVLIGEEARAFVDLPGYGIREVKRQMGSGATVPLGMYAYRPEELSALILARLKANAEAAIKQPITDVVLSVPANFNDAAKQATLQAAEFAGLNVRYLINEPTAAALAFGVTHIDTEAQLVVFDFGGGTLDVSILEMMEGVLEVKSSFGDPRLGGKDFDEAMMGLILQKFTAQHGDLPVSEKARGALKAEAEKAKIRLSSADTHAVHLDYFTMADGNPVDLDVTVTLAEFEAAAAPLLARARQCILDAFKAGKVRPDAIDMVLLVGGATYVPCVRRLVAETLGKTPVAAVDPDLAVCLGAATQAGILLEKVNARDSLVFTDVCPMGIGIDVIAEIGGREVRAYRALIKPNTQIPFSATFPFSLRHALQTEVEISVFQTHQDIDIFPLELGIAKSVIEDIGITGHITDIPPSRYGDPHSIEIDFSYDQNGLIQVHARIPAVNKSATLNFEHSRFRMDATEIREGQQRIADLLANSGLRPLPPPAPKAADPDLAWMDHPAARRLAPLIAQAERLAADRPALTDRLLTAVAVLKGALADGDAAAITAASDTLTDLLFSLRND
jgi:molecular chaperone DnaK